MSRPRHWDFEFGAKRQPAPEHGIKIKKAGTTWWGQHWTSALERILGGDAGRLSRGRTYARAGRTHDLEITNGEVHAKVTGSRPRPYDVTIALPQLSDDAWKRAVDVMASKAQFAAELLAGEMPKEIDEAFRAAGTSLFPAARDDLQTDCTCPDDGDPCKHIAATHYVLGEALDRDPFLLFELRGRTRAAVIAALRDARTPSSKEKKARRATKKAEATPHAVKLGKVTAADYDRPRVALPSLHFSFDAPKTHGSLLRQLGTPAAWRGEEAPETLLGPMVQRAADAARRIAMAEEPSPEAPPKDHVNVRRPRSRK